MTTVVITPDVRDFAERWVTSRMFEPPRGRPAVRGVGRTDGTDYRKGRLMSSGIVARAAGMVATGLAGAAVYDGVKKIARARVVHETAVTVTSWGLRGARAAEAGAERARLTASDIVSEARGRIGEQTPPPGAPAAPDHEH